jgi:hypothetical protein
MPQRERQEAGGRFASSRKQRDKKLHWRDSQRGVLKKTHERMSSEKLAVLQKKR